MGKVWMRARAVVALTALSALAAWASGCGCTEVGCEDLVLVKFSEPTVDPYDIVIVVGSAEGTATCAPGDEVPLTGELEGTVRCEDSSFSFLPATLPLPEELNVDVVVDGVHFNQTFEPDYEGQYPNGEFCGAACETAVVEFDGPSSS